MPPGKNPKKLIDERLFAAREEARTKNCRVSFECMGVQIVITPQSNLPMTLIQYWLARHTGRSIVNPCEDPKKKERIPLPTSLQKIWSPGERSAALRMLAALQRRS